MPSTAAEALAPLAQLLNTTVTFQTGGRIPGWHDGPITVQIFDYVNDASMRGYIDEDLFECFLEDFPHLYDGTFRRTDLLPFALFEGSSTLLFLDIGQGEGARCPVVYWDHGDGDRFTTVAPGLDALGIG